MKKDKKYDAVKEARAIREKLSEEYFKDPEGQEKASKAAREKYEQRLKDKKTK